MPILSNLYSPEDFGSYTNFMAVVMVLMVFVGGRYHHALAIPKKNDEANNVFVLSVITTTVMVLIVLALVLVLKFFLIPISFINESLLIYVPFYVLFYGLWESFALLSVRQLSFKNNAISKVLQSVFFSLFSILLAYYFYISEGLIIGRTIGILLSFVFFAFVTSYSVSGIKIKHLKYVLKKYINYPKYGLIPALLNTVSSQSIVFVLSIYYSSTILGYYGFTALVLIAPLTLIGASYKDVFYQRIAFLFNEEQFNDAKILFLKSALTLFCIATLMSLIIYFFGEFLFSFIFGDKWSVSGLYASILVFSFAIKLVVSPTSTIFNATNQLKKAAVWQTTYFFSSIIFFFICAHYLNLEILLLLKVYVVHELVLYSLYFYLQYNLIQNFINAKPKT